MSIRPLIVAATLATVIAAAAAAQDSVQGGRMLTGAAAFGDWRDDAPGVWRRITPADLPPPGATPSVSNFPRVVSRPAGAIPQAPPGFKVELFASGLSAPRALRVAPNGDIFVAETDAGRIRVLRAPDGANKPSETGVFASGLDGPFGLAFYPTGPDPQWLYVATTTAVVRFPYRGGDLRARGKAQMIVPRLPSGGHTTRDVVFSNDGTRMFVSVGSATNDAEGMRERYPEGLLSFEAQHGLGASWSRDTDRAVVLAFDPDGGGRKTFATGIRNCVGLAVHPQTGDVWCSTNERDGLGDDLVPDFVTRVREGGFYGWPWFYLGTNEDPRHRGERRELKDKITVPDVLIQAHSASLQLVFYTGGQFPADYRGDAFAAEHGSWNRAKRTGYKVIRVKLRDGVPTGEYQDFLTGFVVDERAVWGRPVGVAVARDGALLVSEDANGTIWIVRHQ
ncbi:MAG TPA: PQQ-dependent sugar dehydrogenase [Xanthobacteraceae bacterium]|nr:PQQ-dependent sugar dehydrogenase [Xanthobacteraceae bacterium]